MDGEGFKIWGLGLRVSRFRALDGEAFKFVKV